MLIHSISLTDCFYHLKDRYSTGLHLRRLKDNWENNSWIFSNDPRQCLLPPKPSRCMCRILHSYVRAGGVWHLSPHILVKCAGTRTEPLYNKRGEFAPGARACVDPMGMPVKIYAYWPLISAATMGKSSSTWTLASMTTFGLVCIWDSIKGHSVCFVYLNVCECHCLAPPDPLWNLSRTLT